MKPSVIIFTFFAYVEIMLSSYSKKEEPKNKPPEPPKTAMVIKHGVTMSDDGDEVDAGKFGGHATGVVFPRE